MSGRLLQLSGIVVDLMHHVPHLPGPGEEVETSAVRLTSGGGFNAMVAAKRLGADVTYGGTLGTGPFADIVVADLASAGIDQVQVPRVAMDQGTSTVIVDAAGERSFISYHGAERALSAAHLAAVDVQAYDFVLLTGYSLYKPHSAAVLDPWIGSQPRPPFLLFDPGPVVSSLDLTQVLRRADWISANRQEAEVMTGCGDGARAASLLAQNRQGAVVRAGAAGCWLAVEGAVQHIQGFRVDVVDTTGAGDTHDGAFLAGLMMGLSPHDAALYANAAAALSVTRHGPATAPERGETLQFLGGHGFTFQNRGGTNPHHNRRT